MNPKPVKNIPASIRQRLLNKAKADNRPFNEVLQYFAMERFLYRLSKSTHADILQTVFAHSSAVAYSSVSTISPRIPRYGDIVDR